MEYVDIGVIASTHGLKGEVKVKTDSDFIEERFTVGNTLYLKERDSYKEIVVKSHRSMKGYELVSFVGRETIDDVMFLQGKTIYGERLEELLEDGECFYSDYIGLDCVQFNEVVGKVKDITTLPQCDYLVIENNKGKEVLVPLLDEFIDDVDLGKKTVKIVDMEGLF